MSLTHTIKKICCKEREKEKTIIMSVVKIRLSKLNK